MHDVFISYARENSAQVKRLVDVFIAARGWSIWWDTRLRAGEQFTREIQEALTSTRCVVVVWSGHSVDSDWVMAEASDGWERGILIPVRLDACQPPVPFRQTETADLTSWRGAATDPAVLSLVESIERVLARHTQPGSSELQARERRKRAHIRRRLGRRVAMAVGGVLLVALIWFSYAWLQGQRFAESLAQQADTLRTQVLTRDAGEEAKVWWWLLMEDQERLDRLELSVLLATEAFKRASTERTERSLRAGLALLPWSDKHLPIDIDNSVGALAFSHDSRLLVAGAGTGDTLVWDLETNNVTTLPHGGTGGARDWRDKRGRRVHRGSFVVAVSPVAHVVATAGPDHTARLWEAQTGRELQRLQHEDGVTAVAFEPKGQVLASTTESGTVHLWNVQTGQERIRLQQHAASYWVGISPLGRYVASTSVNRIAHVWELQTGKVITQLQHDGPVEAASFSPDEALLATYGSKIETTIWEVQTGKAVWRLPIASDGDAGVLFDPDGRTFVVASTDGAIEWWHLERREKLRSETVDSYIRAMAANRDRKHLATISADEIARAWDFRTARELRQMPYAGWLTAVAMSPDGRLLASTGRDTWPSQALEVTRVWPEDPIAAACSKLRRTLTPNEWRQFIGDAEPYRPTCPGPETPQPQ